MAEQAKVTHAEKMARMETPQRIAAREYLAVGDMFSGANEFITHEAAFYRVEEAEVKGAVQDDFIEWLRMHEINSPEGVWTHSVRGVARSWYWEKAGISWRD